MNLGNVDRLKQIYPSDATEDYFKSEAGLKALKLAWNTALFLLRKEDDVFQSMHSEYLNLIQSGSIIGVSFFDYGLESFEEYDTRKIKIRLVIALERDSSAGKSAIKNKSSYPLSIPESSFARLRHESKELLAEIAWQEIRHLDVWSRDEMLTYSRQHQFRDEIVEEACWNWDEGGPSASLVFEMVHARDLSEIQEITGRTHEEIFNLLKPYRLPGSALKCSDHTLHGLEVSRLQKSLGQALLDKGFLVIVEPGILIPNSAFQSHRRPDLIALYKGRALAIEIDSSFHLIDTKMARRNAERLLQKLGQKPASLTREDIESMFLDTAYKKKYQTDRLLDRAMLTSGVPVFRFWVSEVEKDPRQVVGCILEAMDSLGGERAVFR